MSNHPTITETVTQWIDNNYRPERLNRDEGTRNRIIADRVTDMESYGEAWISRHDSRNGQATVLRRGKLGEVTSSSNGRTTLYY